MDSEAVLAYGIILGDQDNRESFKETIVKYLEFDTEIDSDSDWEFDWDELLVKALGYKEPDGNFDWSKEYKIKRDLVSSVKVDLIQTGTYDYPTYVLASKGSQYHVEWGAEEVTPVLVEQSWIDDLLKVCQLMGLEYKEPKWILGSFYG